MPTYWCANFELDTNLEHGIDKKLWLMGYQCTPTDDQWRKGRITRNWKTVAKINRGDRLIAYLAGNRFYATGTVETPRRPKTDQDHTDTIPAYLKRRKAHKSGHVYFTSSVVYENFTDSHSDYPARIDVEEWADYVPDGVSVAGLVFPRNKTVDAIFKIDKSEFDRIAKALADASGFYTNKQVTAEEADLSDAQLDEAIQNGQLRFDDNVVAYDKEVMARRRHGQDRLRLLILEIYDNKCALCDISDKALLEASHVVRWADDADARADLANIICLCKFHHALFECGYIALTDKLQVVKKQDSQGQMLASVLEMTSEFRIQDENYSPNPKYLRKHRKRCNL